MFIELAEVLTCPACRVERLVAPELGAASSEGNPSSPEAGPSPHAARRGSSPGLVAMVEALRRRRIMRGQLGCPVCEASYPIRDFTAHFEADPPVRSSKNSASLPEAAIEAAALLAVNERSGYLLLGWGLDAIAGELSKLASSCEVVVLAPASEGMARAGEGVARTSEGMARAGEGAARASEGAARASEAAAPGNAVTFSRLTGVDEEILPFRAASFAGVALWGVGSPALFEAARVLGTGGRVALFEPGGLNEMERDTSALERAGLRVLAADPRALVAERA